MKILAHREATLYSMITVAPLLLICAACAPLPRKVAFQEAAFAPYRQMGSGVVTGTAFTELRNKTRIWAFPSATIELMPDNAYTEEVAEKMYERRRKMAPADARYARYVRKTHPDQESHFSFRGVAPGAYLVACHLTWSGDFTGTNDDGSTYDYESPVDQWIYSRITVQSGKTVKVEEWNQGR